MISRREFLKFAGIALLGTQLDLFLPINTQPILETHGRAFAATPIHHYPAASAPIVARLWPDSLTLLLDNQGNWYRTPQGYVRREDVQPVLRYPPQIVEHPPSIPFWAEVTSPIASVRMWGAADAPLVTRIGHGGTLRVTDYLPASGGQAAWYRVSAVDGTVLGWTPASHWLPIDMQRPNTCPVQLQIERATQQIVVFDGNQSILRAPVSAGLGLKAGEYPVERHEVGDDAHVEFYGGAWPLYFGASQLSGVYWHNRFGQPLPDTTVQVTPMLARWLYQQGVDAIRVL